MTARTRIKPLRGLAALTLSATILVEGCAASAKPPSPASAEEPSRTVTTRRAPERELPPEFWIGLGLTVAVVIIAGSAYALSRVLN